MDVLRTDFLVIGSGIAGLRAAIELGNAGKVIVLTKDRPNESNTEWAQGGIAVALSDEDEVSLHLEDTLRAGDGLCNPEAVKILVEEGIRYISELIEWGTAFDREGTHLSFTREAAHSRSRVLHAKGDSTGSEIIRVLLKKASANPNIFFKPHCFCLDLVVKEGSVWGAYFLDEQDKRVKRVMAHSTILTSGGSGQVYSETTNPDLATGDGLAMAHRAGASLSDMEFFQFHPTALFLSGAPRFLLTEAIRGEGGYLRNIDCSRFMRQYHEMGELAPRDIVSRSIVAELKKTSSNFVYLDLTHLDANFIKNRFPRVYATCLNYNIDITVDMIPVHPAAHYLMGGIKTDLRGRTSMENLYAAGEVACTGVHGANRLASNSLLEGLVYGARLGLAAIADAHRSVPNEVATGASCWSSHTQELHRIKETKLAVQRLMWEKVGILRNGKDLKEALRHLLHLSSHLMANTPDRAECELRNLMTVGELIIVSAMAREESRGAHYRSDWPCRNEQKFKKHSVISKSNHVDFIDVVSSKSTAETQKTT
ncbi:MAG: L-aspartate oxidase [Acidobacteria bacterium]|nr:MAG: L-aspartate oxidase [Acidobacteriota bacterium]